MQNRGAGIAVAVIGVVAAVVLFVVLGGGDGSDDSSGTSTTVESATTTPDDGGGQSGGGQSGGGSSGGGEAEVPTIVVKGGEPVGGVQELEFTEDDDIRFVVESDVADEVHFHGYDVAEEVEAGGEVEFDVPATLTGEFEVELEERVVPIAEITVNPA